MKKFIQLMILLLIVMLIVGAVAYVVWWFTVDQLWEYGIKTGLVWWIITWWWALISLLISHKKTS